MTDTEMLEMARRWVKRDDGSMFRLRVPEIYLLSWQEVGQWGKILQQIAEEHEEMRFVDK